MMRFAVAGTTSWGITLAWLLARNGHEVALLCRTEAEAADLAARRALARFPAIVLPLAVTPCVAAEAGRCDGLVVAVPAQHLRAAVARLEPLRGIPVVSGAKGIEHGSHLRMTQVLTACGWRQELVAALSGPNLAREMAEGLPAASVVAAFDEASARMWQAALTGPAFRIYRGDDVAGVEFGGALKNVVAIAAGACSGLGLGSNAMAAVITRGLAEITRLGVAHGAQPLTFLGLAGVGDLVATCMSPLSRNHRLGTLLAKGRAVDEALAEIRETVEGAETAPVALEMAREAGIEMPITEQVCAVLAGQGDVQEAMSALLARAVTAEPA
jgi:glycerol-3-phosphate dehydrogenase (NAD(P)+)